VSDKKAPAKASADKGEKKKGGKLPLIIAIVAVLAAGGAGAGWYLSSSKSAEAEHAAAAPKKPAVPAPALYLPLDPAFVVNLSGAESGPQYLQVEVQLMTRDAVQLEHLKSNAPAIRAALLMLFAQQRGTDVIDVPGRKKLQAAALAEVQKLMSAETGEKCAEGLLFTSFVTQ
jgi:flagellar protein FliL